MNPACQHYRTDLPERLDGRLDFAALASSSADEHRAQCADCAAWVAGLARLTESLYALPRVAAPKQLDGLVVATLEAGAREARAVRAVEGLTHLHSPETLAETLETELEEGVENSLPTNPLPGSEQRLGAPSVLERLVREELAEPEKHTVRRAVGGLERLRAPAELEALVQATLAGQPPIAETGRPAFKLLRAKHLAWASAAAAVLLLAGPFGPFELGRLQDSSPSGEEPAARTRSFEVVYVRSLNDLDPVARNLVDGVSGGLLTAKGL